MEDQGSVLTTIIAAHYNGLVAAGLERADALELTLAYQAEFLQNARESTDVNPD